MADRYDGAEGIVKRWRDADRALVEPRRHYWLNEAFFDGQQWVSWDESSNSVKALSELGHHARRSRVVFNEIQPRVRGLMGRMLADPLTFEVSPTRADDFTRRTAAMNQSILDHAHDRQQWEAKRRENLFNKFLGGVSAVAVDWDPRAGTPLMVNQNSGVITGGDVQLTALSIPEFTVEPGVRNWREARWWMSDTVAPPELVQDQFGLDDPPKADARAATTPTARRLTYRTHGSVAEDLTHVYRYYERPNQATPDGKVCVVVNDDLIFEGPWPFPFNDLNLHVFIQDGVAHRWWGETMVSQARPIQVYYNHLKSATLENSKYFAGIKLALPQGSMGQEQELTDEPEILEYAAEFGQPSYLAPPEAGRHLQNETRDCLRHLDEVLHTHAVARGESLGERASGLMVSILAEKDDTPLSMSARDEAIGWGNVARMVLELYKANVHDPREAMVREGPQQLPQSVKWTGRDIGDQTDVQVSLQSTLPKSRAAMIAQLETLVQLNPALAQNLTLDDMAKFADMPTRSVFDSFGDRDAKLAQEENHLLFRGEPVIPNDYDDHAAHIAEHNDFRKESRFRDASPEVQQLVEMHVQAHQRLAEEELVQQRQVAERAADLAMAPQANEPPGSMVPRPSRESQATEER